MNAEHGLRGYQNGEAICLQGEKAECIFILRAGKVGIFIHPTVAAPEIAEVLRAAMRVAVVADAGSLIGEAGLFTECRGASVLALEDGTVVEHLALRQEGLQKAMIEHPALALKICRGLAQRLRNMTGAVRNFSLAADAVARAVDRLAMEYAELLAEAAEVCRGQPAIKERLAALAQDELANQGLAAKRHRNDTSSFFLQTARHRSGAIRLSTGDVLCEEGRPGRAIYFVRQGQLEVKVANHIIGHIGPAEVVGEIAVLLHEAPKRSATVRAAVPTVLAAVPMPDFFALAEKHPQVLVTIAKQLAQRLEMTNRLVCHQMHRGADIVAPLAGGPASCQAHFQNLADMLAPLPGTAAIAKRALQAAGRASRLQQEILQTHRALLAQPASETGNA